MTFGRKKLGADAESLAAQFLIKKGMQVVQQNYRCRLGEIDLIVRDGRHLVFVEVKSRRSLEFGAPSLAVNWRKQQKLTQLAQVYLKQKGLWRTSCRFDVVSVYAPVDGSPEIKHIPNAFMATH